MASRHGIVSAEADADLRAASRALARATPKLRQLIDATGRQQMTAAWGEELRAAGGSKAQRKFVAAPHSVIPGNSSLYVGTGDDPLTKPYEFGANDRETYREYDRRNLKNPGTHRVRRRTKRQLPERRAGGWLAYPSANRFGSRAFKMWGSLIQKVTHDAWEGKA